MKLNLVALLSHLGAACGLLRLCQWLSTWRGKRAYAKQQKRREAAGRAAQAALDRRRAAEQQPDAGWSFERRTWRG